MKPARAPAALAGALLLALAPLSAAAQPLAAGAQPLAPAVQACRAYAEAELKRSSAQPPAVVFDAEGGLRLERHARKAGSQPVSELLYGNGAIVYPSGLPVEMSFVCLLANERRAVFFHWLPRRDAPVLAQCRRAGDPGACLDTLQQLAEQELTEIYARHLVEARQADAAAGSDAATAAFRRSADAWRAYRDAECARRAAAGDGANADKACKVELARQRARELR